MADPKVTFTKVSWAALVESMEDTTDPGMAYIFSNGREFKNEASPYTDSANTYFPYTFPFTL